MTLFKGHHTIKIYGKAIIGENNNESGGGEQQVLDGMVGGLLYSNGTLFTGVSGGNLYSNGTLFTGTSEGLYYVSGVLYTGYINSNYYNNGNIIVSSGSRTWTSTTSSLTYIKARASSVLLNDGRLLFAGGLIDSPSTGLSIATNHWEIHDPAQNFITTHYGITDGSGEHAPMPGAVYFNKLIKLNNGKVVSIGRYSSVNSTVRRETYLFDPQTYQWSSTSITLPTSAVLFNNTIDLIPGTNKVVVFGGTDASGNSPSNQGYILDYDSNTLTEMQSLSVDMAYHSSVFLPNGNLMVWGGNNNSNGRAYSYNFDTNNWSFLAQTGLNAHSTTSRYRAHVVDNSYVYFIGPKFASSQDIKKYTINSNSFTGLEPSIASGEVYPDGVLNTVLLNNNTFLIYGRELTSNTPGTIGIFDPSNNTYSSLNRSGLFLNVPIAADTINLFLLTNNKLVAYAGETNKSYCIMDF
jgi:hypothetical protein